MNTPEADTVSLGDIASVVRRNALFVLITSLFGVAAALLIADYLPHRYKSKAVLSVHSSYFAHPLVSDLISEVHDPSELGAQRSALLRLALSEPFLDSIGKQYQLYAATVDDNELAREREELFKRIQYFSITPTSFQLSIATDTPQKSLAVTQAILDQMTKTLIGKRYQTLMQARDAIIKQAKLLNKALSAGGYAAPQNQQLEAQLGAMEANLSELRSRFTDMHPDVIITQNRVEALRNRLKRLIPEQKPAESTDDYSSLFLSPASRATSQQIFDDLLKKISHLNIILETERDRDNVSYLTVIEQPTLPARASFPDRMQFAAGGAILGLLIGLIIAGHSELTRASFLAPEAAAELVGIEYLGGLPVFDRTPRRPMIAGPNNAVTVLPFRARET